MVLAVSHQFLDFQDARLVVASIGASAVLLFAAPHGPLSQPWSLCGGHIVSAFVGVTCYWLIPNVIIAAALAVGLAIIAMYYLRCIHPPGGATALTVVLGGPSVHSLGYQYVVTPVLINVCVLLTLAIAFNYLFTWRRYPAAMMHYNRSKSQQNKPAQEGLSRDDIEHALAQMNLYVDVNPDDLNQIYELARNRSKSPLAHQQIQVGHYYSNGEYGSHWSVRQLVDEPQTPPLATDLVIYKIVAGQGRRSSGSMTREAFAQWAQHEVFLNENSWQRVAETGQRKAGT